MPIIKNGVVIKDPWIVIADDAPLPASQPVIVSLARWLAEGEALRGRNGLLGVRLRSAELAEDIAADLEHLSLVAIEFPTIGDGRGYTTGRLLRERYGFTGELRAVGANRSAGSTRRASARRKPGRVATMKSHRRTKRRRFFQAGSVRNASAPNRK